MTSEEKRQLCIMINNLESKHLVKVIQIIYRALPNFEKLIDVGCSVVILIPFIAGEQIFRCSQFFYCLFAGCNQNSFRYVTLNVSAK